MPTLSPMSNTDFKYPACGFCRNFQWEAGNTSSAQCSEMHREVTANGDVCGFYKAACNEQAIKEYMAFQKMLIEVDMRPKLHYSPYLDACGNNYEGLSRSECMDVLVNHVEEYGLWYELDVMFDPFGNGCDFFFAPDVMFHFSADEYEAFYARISNAIKKFHEQFNETPRL